MIRFVRGNVKPDTPLLYLLPIFGVLLLILIWSALSDYLASEHDRVVRNAVSEAASHARAFERSTGQLLRAVDQATRLIQREFERSQQGRDPFDLAAIAKAALGPLDMVSLVSVVDRSGNATVLSYSRGSAAPSLAVGANGMTGEAFTVHRNADLRKLYVGRPVVDAAQNRTLIPMTRRISSPDGSFGGVVAVWVDPARFTDAYDVAEQGRHGLLAILGQDGVFRALRSGDTTSAGAKVDYAAVMAQVQRSGDHSVAVTGLNDDIPRFASSRPLAPYGVVALVGAAEDEVMAEHREQWGYYLKYAVAASLVIVGVLAVAMLLVIRMKQSHRETEMARATYRAAAEGSLDAFFLLHTVKGRDQRVSEFVVEDANSRALQLLKMPREKVVGMRLRTLLPKLVRRRLYRRFFRVLETGESIEEEIETDWGMQGARWFRHQVVPIEGGSRSRCATSTTPSMSSTRSSGRRISTA